MAIRHRATSRVALIIPLTRLFDPPYCYIKNVPLCSFKTVVSVPDANVIKWHVVVLGGASLLCECPRCTCSI